MYQDTAVYTKGVFSRSSELEKHLKNLLSLAGVWTINIKWNYDFWNNFWKRREMVAIVNRNSKFDNYMDNLRITYIERITIT